MAESPQTPSPMTPSGLCVVGDLGGTRVRLALVSPETGDLERVSILPRIRYEGVLDAVSSWLADEGIGHVDEICLAVAGPVEGDHVRLPNTEWSFSCRELQQALGTHLTVINDFTAQAFAIERLSEDELEWLGTPRPTKRGVEVVIGPGTGLGAAVRTTSGEIIPSEAGHIGLAPANEEEIRVLRLLMDVFSRVSIERVVSGPGLENLFWAVSVMHGKTASPRPPVATAPEIHDLALEGDAEALRAIRLFFDLLASFAGDMALANWATGGVFISGGVIEKLEEFFDREHFRARFEDKGRFRTFCEGVPIAVVKAKHPGLIGCVAALSHAPERARARHALDS